jgi:hypothetical protein
MPIADPNRIYDGFSDLSGGADAGRLPNLIDPSQFAEGENIVVREGAPQTRPPFLDVALTFTNANLEYNEDGTFKSEDGSGIGASRTAFRTGIFQEASYYAPRSGQEFIMVTVGGRLYQFTFGNGQTASVREVQLERRNRADIPIAYHLQAGIYHITQDAEARPIIFDGVAARRSGIGEIFTGKMMGYGQGRIILIGKNGEVFFGDIRDGKNGGDADVLGFTETTFLNEGFPSGIPSFMGQPTAIQFLPAQDTATGVGECLVFGQSGVESFFLSIPRDQWKDSQFQRTALLGVGNEGHRNVAVVNQDLWFKSEDGRRSYRQARAQINQWAQIPMSTNVRKWIENETPELAQYGSSITFNNRLIMTVTPYFNHGRPYHNGLLSLDFDVISSFGRTSGPAWDGHWTEHLANPLTGLKVTQLISGMFGGRERAFAFVINVNGDNALIELSSVTAGKDSSGGIVSRVVTRAMDFKSPFNEKKLYGGDVWIDKVSEESEVAVYYRPDQSEAFQTWTDFTLEPVGEAGAITPGMVPTLENRFAPRRGLPKPADTGDSEQTKRIFRRFYEAQVKLEWFGRLRMRKLRLHAQDEIENSKATIP